MKIKDNLGFSLNVCHCTVDGDEGFIQIEWKSRIYKATSNNGLRLR